MGQCFTSGGEEPSPGKEALIQRTVCLQARAETDEDSPDKDFKEGLSRPDIKQRISDFQLFTSMSGFGLLSIMGLPWLQPDFAVANQIFKEGDRMLSSKYGMPKPEPRRLVKRLNNLTTMCMHEAIARVYMFKQTAVAYEAGRPDAHGAPKKFDIGDFWDVIRTLRPTREMILAAWSHSLEYSIGTSSHGVNVMNAICERLGFVIDKVFRKMHTKSASELMPGADGEGEELRQYMRTKEVDVPGGTKQAIGADPAQLQKLADELKQTREVRNEFRLHAAGARDTTGNPLDAIQAISRNKDSNRRYSGALFPTLRTVCAFYKPKAVMRWAVGHPIKTSEVSNGYAGGTGLPFKVKGGRRASPVADGADGDGGSKEHDFAWFVLSDQANKDGTGASWKACADVLKKSKMCGLFDMHSAGIADACFMLASNENKRACPEMPSGLPFSSTQGEAFRDKDGKPFNSKSGTMVPQKFGLDAAHTGTALECRPIYDVNHSSKIPIHAQLDLLHNRGRLPALMPHTSTKVETQPPIRWQNGSGVEVNSVVVYEHVCMVMENIIACSKVPGLKGLQERFLSGGSAPSGLRADVASEGIDARELAGVERTLPYSIDVTQMAWTIELARRFYTKSRDRTLLKFNHRLYQEGLGAEILSKDLPEISLRYPGFPKEGGEPALRLISVPIGTEEPAKAQQVDIAKANPLQSIDQELLRYQTSVAIGRAATGRDIEEHRRSLIGAGYVWGVEGDVFSFDTWQAHAFASMIGRGNFDPARDKENGGYKDKALAPTLDPEMMRDARLVERRALKNIQPEAKYNITQPTGSTYTFLETQERALANSTTLGKRSAAAAPRLTPKRQTVFNVMDELYSKPVRGSSQNVSPSLRQSDRQRVQAGSPSARRSDSRDDE